MKNSDSTAMPISIAINKNGDIVTLISESGLTKRENFAGLIMQGFAADPNAGGFID